MAKIVIKSISQLSMTVYIDELSSTYPRDDRILNIYLNDSATAIIKNEKLSPYITKTKDFTIDIEELSSKWSHKLVAIISYTNAEGEEASTMLVKEFAKPSSTTYISPWDWKSSNGTATSIETEKAETAIKERGKCKDFSYKVWNDLVSKVNEYIVKYQQYTWNTSFPKLTLAQTKMSEEDRKLTADRFNCLRYQMNEWMGAKYSEVNKGDVVYGSYFIELVEKMNKEIDNANLQ